MMLDPLEDADASTDRAEADIQELLGRMPLARPPSRLDDRVRFALLRGQGRWIALGAFTSAAAALVAVGVLLPRHSSTEISPLVSAGAGSHALSASASILPSRLRIERDTERVEDAGIVARLNGVPVREIHYRAQKQVWYYDAKRGTQLSVTVPVDRVVIVPVRTF
jgi:hypothetical protein